MGVGKVLSITLLQETEFAGDATDSAPQLLDTASFSEQCLSPHFCRRRRWTTRGTPAALDPHGRSSSHTIAAVLRLDPYGWSVAL